MNEFRIEPCILVSDALSVERGVTYHRRDISKEVHSDGSEDATWQTDRHYKNREEAKEAERVYAKARQRIRSQSLYTEIGFVCPMSKQTELANAIAEARQIVDDFNAKARHCHVHFRVVCTRIEPNNVDGAATLQDTLTKSVSEIRNALQNFDPKKARDVLSSTKELVEILGDPQTKRELAKAREESAELAKEIKRLVKEYDGNVKNALASANGDKLVARATAAWNF
jgi:hypothetical protein